MTSVGLRELRQNASGLIRRVEHGEEIEVTVQGRLTAVIVPPDRGARRPRTVDGAVFARALAELPPDATGWAEEAYALRDNDPLEDPWEPA
jgi:prevent-host-death family protein